MLLSWTRVRRDLLSPLALPAAASVVAVAGLSHEVLADGGLAPPLGALLVAFLLAAPTATLEASHDELPPAERQVFYEVTHWLLAGALAARAATLGGLWWLAPAAVAALALRLPARAGFVASLASMGLLAAASQLLLGAQSPPPLTLLAPDLTGSARWAWSVQTGLLLGAVGMGAWSGRPGPRLPVRLPWLLIAVAGVALLGRAIGLSAAYEGSGAQTTLLDPWLQVVGGMAMVAALLRRREGGRQSRALGLLLLAYPLALSGREVIDAVFQVLAPLSLGVGAMADARAWKQVLPAIAGMLAVVTAIWSWRGFPDEPLAASVLALVGVAALWWVALTRPRGSSPAGSRL